MPPKGKGKAPAKGKGGGAKTAAAKAERRAATEIVRLSPRSSTGTLVSDVLSRDIKIDNFSLSLHGVPLVENTRLDLNFGRRYGLLGLNGSGKSTILACLGEREVPIPEHITIFHLSQEIEGSEKTALEAVLEKLDEERKKLEKEAERLSLTEEGASSESLQSIYDQLDELDPDTAESRAAKILHGLGFSPEMQRKQTKDFSGGWRMRISLAQALFVNPMLLLLDEPTNHLDLEACVWLEEFLKKYKRILVVISHSQDFLNNVCDKIMHIQNKTLTYYTGNYDTYVKTRKEKEENQMKQYMWAQDQVAHIKDFIQRFGSGSRASQAKSREKTLQKIEESGALAEVQVDRVVPLHFDPCGTLAPPVLQFNQVTFTYSEGRRPLYQKLDLGVDLDSRVALVGPNGVGKSTLLKLMVGDLIPTEGMVRRHHHLRIAYYHQHLKESLDLNMTPLEFMLQSFGDHEEIDTRTMRGAIGRFGISGKLQTAPMRILSDGQRSRVVFAWLCWKQPHLLLLDEPTNHLDMETIDALAEAINEWDGGMVLVSHDFRLINQVAKEIWVCENRGIRKWDGDIQEYKNVLREKLLAEE